MTRKQSARAATAATVHPMPRTRKARESEQAGAQAAHDVATSERLDPNASSRPKPSRPKLTPAERLAKQEERYRREGRQLDIMRTRSLADDAKILRGRDKKAANLLAREALALAVLAGRLGADQFLALRTAIGDDIAALQRDDPATRDAVDALDESGSIEPGTAGFR